MSLGLNGRWQDVLFQMMVSGFQYQSRHFALPGVEDISDAMELRTMIPLRPEPKDPAG
ncbi:MAG: hypothetical protein PVJ53_04330 [Desulfobacterales bacterium]|jgi:hypothetical protein